MSKKKLLIFIILAIVNLIVILSFIFFTKRIRQSDELKLNQIPIQMERGQLILASSFHGKPTNSRVLQVIKPNIATYCENGG